MKLGGKKGKGRRDKPWPPPWDAFVALSEWLAVLSKAWSPLIQYITYSSAYLVQKQFLYSLFSLFYVCFPWAAAVTNCSSYHPFLIYKADLWTKNNQTMPLMYKNQQLLLILIHVALSFVWLFLLVDDQESALDRTFPLPQCPFCSIERTAQSANQPKYQNTYLFLVNWLDFAASCSLYSTSHGQVWPSLVMHHSEVKYFLSIMYYSK